MSLRLMRWRGPWLVAAAGSLKAERRRWRSWCRACWCGEERAVVGDRGGGEGGRGEGRGEGDEEAVRGVTFRSHVIVSGCLRRVLAMRHAEMTLQMGDGVLCGGWPMRWNGDEMVLVAQSMVGLTAVRKGLPRMPSYP